MGNFFITGGAGFVGSHLTGSLLKDGNAVTVIDDLSTGRWDNVAEFDGMSGFRAIIASAADLDILEREIPRHDFVYHLASSVGVQLIIDEPVRTVENIFGTTDAVFRVCARYRRPVLLTSTSEVYGKAVSAPFKEDSDVVMGPTSKRRWAYACAKALDEFLALAHHHHSRLPTYIVRLFNTVGPRQLGRYGMVLPRFVGRALRNEPLRVYGDGTQTRCFASVHDVVDALKRFPGNEIAAGRVINLGSQEEVSIAELAHRVIESCDSSSQVHFVDYHEAYGPGFDDMPRRVPDLALAEELLGWRPTSTLDDIIKQVRDDFSHEKSSPG